MTEKELTKLILDYLRIKGAWAYRTHGPLFPPLPENKGISDIAGIYRQRPLYIEVKGKGKKCTDLHQLNFIANAQDQGALAFWTNDFEHFKARMRLWWI